MEPTNSNELPASQNSIHKGNLFLKIWTQPTATFQFIFKNQPEKYIHIFLILGGITNALNKAADNGLGETMSITGILVTSILAGGAIGWAIYLVIAWLLSFSGSFINGKATANQFQIVIGWALLPHIANLLLLPIYLFVFGTDYFKGDLDEMTVGQTRSLYALALVSIILEIWSLIIMVKGTAIIQNFSIGKAVLNVLLPVFGFVILGALIVFLLGDFILGG